MPSRRKRKLSSIHPLAWFLLLCLALIGYQLITDFGLILALAGIPAAYLIGRNRERAETGRLRQSLAEAQDSAQQAWDESAARKPRVIPLRPEDGSAGRRDKLLTDPRSGARPLR